MKRLVASVGSALRAFRVRSVVPVVVLLLCVLSVTSRAQNPMPPAKTPPVELSLREQVFEVEDRAAALAKTIRAGKLPPAELNQQWAELKALVAQAFELRQDIQEHEVEQLRQQQLTATQTLQRREQQRDKLLERRVQELFKGEVVGWPEMKLRDDDDELSFDSEPLQDSPVVALKPLAERGPDDPRTVRADGQSEAVVVKIQQALAREFSIEFTETPLTDAIGFLSQKSKLKIVIDPSVEAAGTAPDTPISLPSLKLPLRAILNLMLRPLNLTTVIHDEIFVVTTLEEAMNRRVVKVYQLSDLLDRSNKLRSLACIEGVIRACTSGRWEDTDGAGGSLDTQLNSQSLVISQTHQVHEEIENVLRTLRTPRDPQVRFLRADGERIADIDAIEAALAQQSPINFQETPLIDALVFFAQKHAIPILLDPEVEAAGTAPDTPITLPMVNGTLKSALKLVLKPLNLTTIQRDGLLIVTTVEDAENRLSARVYELEDLLDPANRATSLQGLMQTIHTTVAGRWVDFDGIGGSMSLAPTNARLIVRQTDATHEAITHLLNALRIKNPPKN